VTTVLKVVDVVLIFDFFSSLVHFLNTRSNFALLLSVYGGEANSRDEHCLQVKPSINQVNLTTCCVIPQDLKDFANENDIELLTHNDPTGIRRYRILYYIYLLHCILVHIFCTRVLCEKKFGGHIIYLYLFVHGRYWLCINLTRFQNFLLWIFTDYILLTFFCRHEMLAVDTLLWKVGLWPAAYKHASLQLPPSLDSPVLLLARLVNFFNMSV